MASGYPQARDHRGRARRRDGICRDCKLPIRWVTMPSGKRNPLELEPHLLGNVIVLERDGDWLLGVHLHDDELADEARAQGFDTYVSHFTPGRCPERRGRERADLA